MKTDEQRVSEKFYFLHQRVGDRGLLEAIVEALTVDELEQCLDYIAYEHGIEFQEVTDVGTVHWL